MAGQDTGTDTGGTEPVDMNGVPLSDTTQTRFVRVYSQRGTPMTVQINPGDTYEGNAGIMGTIERAESSATPTLNADHGATEEMLRRGYQDDSSQTVNEELGTSGRLGNVLRVTPNDGLAVDLLGPLRDMMTPDEPSPFDVQPARTPPQSAGPNNADPQQRPATPPRP